MISNFFVRHGIIFFPSASELLVIWLQQTSSEDQLANPGLFPPCFINLTYFRVGCNLSTICQFLGKQKNGSSSKVSVMFALHKLIL